LKFTEIPYVTEPISRPELKPQLEDRTRDNVLFDQGYGTPQGAVIDEYGAMVE
jgi:hypothetical protein